MCKVSRKESSRAEPLIGSNPILTDSTDLKDLLCKTEYRTELIIVTEESESFTGSNLVFTIPVGILTDH